MAHQSRMPASIRRTHDQRILRVLGKNGALSRSEIAARLGLSRTTLSEVTNALLEQGAIVVVDNTAGTRVGRGRPAERLALDPGAGQLMGIDFGRARVHVAVADASHRVIASGECRYDSGSTWTERIDDVSELIDGLSTETGVHYGALQGIGIGFPGPLASRTPGEDGEFVGRKRRDESELVRSSFAERFGAPVIIDNNTRFAALAEASWGEGADTEHLLYLRLSDGIGGGLIVGGRLLVGSSGFAGELGHVSIDVSGALCHCGKRGCLETVASVPAILAHCQAAGAAVGDLDQLRVAVAQADPVVDKVLREAATAVGRVIGAAAVALNPSEIVIGGELIDIAPAVLRQAAATISYELLPMLETAPTIRGARFGNDAGVLGALLALFHQSPLLASYPQQELRTRPVHVRRHAS